MSEMKKYGDGDIKSMRFKLWDKLGFIKRSLAPVPGSTTTDAVTWSAMNAPQFDFFWAPETDRQKTQIIVTFVGKHGPVGMSEDEDVFPSDELVAKIRLVML